VNRLERFQNSIRRGRAMERYGTRRNIFKITFADMPPMQLLVVGGLRLPVQFPRRPFRRVRPHVSVITRSAMSAMTALCVMTAVVVPS
jgi:hypothetical protein